jgi:toxin YoeB
MVRLLSWTDDAWDDYLHWQQADRKLLKRINLLIADIQCGDPFEGIGKPEALRHGLAGAWSRRIDGEHRLVYSVDDERLTIIQARYHY